MRTVHAHIRPDVAIVCTACHALQEVVLHAVHRCASPCSPPPNTDTKQPKTQRNADICTSHGKGTCCCVTDVPMHSGSRVVPRSHALKFITHPQILVYVLVHCGAQSHNRTVGGGPFSGSIRQKSNSRLRSQPKSSRGPQNLMP